MNVEPTDLVPCGEQRMLNMHLASTFYKWQTGVAENRHFVTKSAKIIAQLVKDTSALGFNAWLHDTRWHQRMFLASKMISSVFQRGSQLDAFEVWRQQTSYGRMKSGSLRSFLRKMLALFTEALLQQRRFSQLAGVCRARASSDCQRKVLRLWKRRATVCKVVRVRCKETRQGLVIRIFHWWLRRGLYGALSRKARHMLEAMHQTKVSDFTSRRAHFFRRFRASFYLWVMVTAVMYEARSQRAKALRRMRLRTCHNALCSWMHCVAVAHTLQQSSVRALHAATAIKRTTQMIIPVPVHAGFLFRKN